ncbi:hypothetical protein GCM10010435_50760 [Winogradskya consettensis]|uniref:Uncharacterized protein n=1 Tax=Winogradskya consettensis TaxID=113560 RepID=A0A919SHP3_9ACTN|nr:hypothetical protein [Actinoplanes consettensis]GIM72095.1 hypothetical protein Aco04nite_28670 [Actinoplanes consettensis]
MTEIDTLATSTFAVHRGAWERTCPTLTADLAAMVAPPITVSAFPVTSAPAATRARVKEARMRQNLPFGTA